MSIDVSGDPRRLIACSRCDAANRVPEARLGDDPVCGRCAQPLLDGTSVTLTDANFERVVGRTELPVVVDVWATWCGPCKAMAPQFDRAARELKGRAVLAKLDSDANPQTAARFAIRSIPTLLKFEGGKETKRLSGAMQAPQIVAWVQAAG